jgi:transposase
MVCSMMTGFTRTCEFSLGNPQLLVAFHRAYYHATQQAFLEAHELAFDYFGGVFRYLRYDNLKSAVKKVLRGYQREETERVRPTIRRPPESVP